MVTIEGIMKVMKEDVHKLCKFHSEQFKLKQSSLEGQLLLLQLNSLHRLLRVWKLFTVQLEVIVLVQILMYWIN